MAKGLPKDTGKYVFLVGFAIALIAGLVGAAIGVGNYGGYISLILVILGILVGFLNITPKERTTFLIAAIALAALGLVSFKALTIGAFDFGAYLTSVVDYIVVFVAPAAAIAALYQIYELAKS